MEFRTLPKTGLRVSRLAFGSMTFGAQKPDEAAARTIMDCCLDAGIILSTPRTSTTAAWPKPL